MIVFSKDEIARAGLCEACTSKFAVECECLCWDCLYESYARAAAHKGHAVSISVSTAWKSPQRR